MIELTVTIFDKDGELYGIGEVGRPNHKLINNSCDRWSFVRGDVRISVLAVTPGVTVEEARIFAIFTYEGKGIRVNIQDVYDTGLTPLSNGRHLFS